MPNKTNQPLIEITSQWYLEKHPVGFPNTIEFDQISEFQYGNLDPTKGSDAPFRLFIALGKGKLTEITTLSQAELKDFRDAYNAWCDSLRKGLPKVKPLAVNMAITPNQLLNNYAVAGAFALGKTPDGLLTINGFCHSDCDGTGFASADRYTLNMLFGREFMDECDSIINRTEDAS